MNYELCSIVIYRVMADFIQITPSFESFRIQSHDSMRMGSVRCHRAKAVVLLWTDVS
jgi:hypothetical protein